MSRLQKLLGVGKGYLERLPPVDVHKLLRIVLMNLPYIVIFYVGNKLAWLYQYCVGDSMIERLMVLVLNFQMAFSRILPSMHKNELLVGITGAVAVKLLVYMKGKNAKKFRQGVEYGSARWGTAKDIAPFIDPVFENNILLTMTDRRTNFSKNISGVIRTTYGNHVRVFQSEIPYSVRAAEMSAQGQSIFSFDPKGKVAAAYDALTKEVLTIEQQKSSRDAHCL